MAEHHIHAFPQDCEETSMGQQRARQIRTAFHEAGHLVVGTHQGLNFIRATILPENYSSGLASSGRTDWEPLNGTFDVFPYVLVGVAGELSEQMYAGCSEDDGTRDDMAFLSALAWCCLACGDNYAPESRVFSRLVEIYRNNPSRIPVAVRRLLGEMVDEAMPIAAKILAEKWTDVEQFAALLLKHRTVTPGMLQRNETGSK